MVKSYSKRVFELITKPEMKILPGHLAFFLILSVFPLLTLIGYIISNLTMSIVPSTAILEKFIPGNVSNILISFLSESHLTENITLVMIIGFALVSNGTYSIITVSDEVFGIKSKSEIKKRIKSILMIFIFMFLFLFVLVVLAYGSNIVKYVTVFSVFSSISDQISFVYQLIRWPIAFIILFGILKFFYTISPDENIPSKYMNKGSLFTTVGWIITTFIYSFYVSHFADYTLFYGGLSGIIVMMVWVYMLSFIFVMGIAINADEYLDHKYANKNKKKVKDI
ncbi:MAG: YihY/virulence factor BrkB family protein [Bacilli bacterium]|nr:YihY/virulence factor BrkB family protein [Bacilli bacterium]